MGKRIDLPQLPAGQPQEQLQALYSYLYQMADALNNNLAEIGNGDFTDQEMIVVRQITGQTETTNGMAEAETLKSLIIKTAQLIKTEIDQYNLKLIGTYEADGKLGRYVRKTKLDVDVTPTGIQQNYSFQEIIQGLKTYEINAKNYIKTGLLRTVSSVPVYGVAIGKDVVTFSEDGTETYNDGNKVAELTADELSFWQNGNKVASYTGTELSFYANGTKMLTINSGGVAVDGPFNVSSDNVNISKYGTASLKNQTTGSETYFGQGLIRMLDKSDPNNIKGMAFMDDQTMNGIKYRLQIFQDSSGDAVLQIGNNNIISKELHFVPEIMDWGTEHNRSGVHIKGRNSNDYPVIGSSDIPFFFGYFTYLWCQTLYQTSSREIKHDIRNMEAPGEKLDRLRPVTFVYDEDPEERTRQGLIYEETIGVMPEICTKNEAAKAINYVDLIPVLLKEIQELRARVKALEERGGE